MKGSPLKHEVRQYIYIYIYVCITRTAPSYLCDSLQFYTPSRTLRSASDTLSLQIPRTGLSTVNIYIYVLKGNLSQPCVFSRGDLNFCLRTTALRGQNLQPEERKDTWCTIRNRKT